MNGPIYLAGDIDRFFAKVEKTPGCWLWLGATDRKSYGRFSVGGSRHPDGTRRNSMVAAHRFSFELQEGPIPAGDGFHGTCVLHRCDNPRCVNPEHLFLGSNADNVRDMISKGRARPNPPKGSAHKLAKLNEEQVRQIVCRYSIEKISQKRLANEFGVCLATVSHILTGRNWSHLGLRAAR